LDAGSFGETPAILKPSEALNKIEDLRFSSIAYEQHLSALAIIAVLGGIRPAFMCDEIEFLEECKEAGRRLGLHVLVTKRAPTERYRIRKPNVPPSFIDAFHGGGSDKEKRAVWLFKEAGTSERISRAVSGQLDEGSVLGYPDCCTKEYEEERAKLVETVYQQIVERYQAKTDEEAVKILLTDPPFRVQKTLVRESFGRFPYISHIACSACISGRSAESSRLNRELRKLSEEVGLKERVIGAMTDLLAGESARLVDR